ncbi:substrate-binding periplasmic protein [Bowmanella yangjiangensis]|uniref:Transporter substrate-binding domain-containing protein n=1 Tax=Bowmanella yangjiangensis TaxID=2811230 RepID=A0ABS3CQS2_9ALTE|nr:transporter substrate-binding domain-containing protein [Bowmanella yangjiangensis]MBN7819457.1 transporter substrate-binding domain-containing protein [Bowmanella yangjiangensis]
MALKQGWLLALGLMVYNLGWARDESLAILTHPEPPFVFTNTQGELDGYAVQLVRAIQEQANSHAPILLHPWARVYLRASTEPNLMVFSMVRNADREENFHWITPITRNPHGLFAKKSTKKTIHSLTDLAALPAVGVQRGDFREQLMIDAGLENIVSYTSWEQAMGALLKDRVNALFFSAAGISYFCMQLQEDCSEIVNIYQHQVETTYLAMSKHGTSLEDVRQWQAAAQRYKESQAFRLLADYWLNRYRQEFGFTLELQADTMYFAQFREAILWR